MKTKALILAIAIGATLFTGCSSKTPPETTPPVVENPKIETTTPSSEDSPDAVASASFPNDTATLEKALGAEGTWIVLLTNDLTSDKDVVVDGQFHNKNDASQPMARKLGLYAQDENKTVTASYTLTAPKMVVKSENFKIQEGVFKGDIYVESNGFTVKNTKVEGNIYFSKQEYKDSFVQDGGTITGVIEVK